MRLKYAEYGNIPFSSYYTDKFSIDYIIRFISEILYKKYTKIFISISSILLNFLSIKNIVNINSNNIIRFFYIYFLFYFILILILLLFHILLS